MLTILFLHGWNSVPGGVKPSYLRDHGHIVVNPKLPDDDFDAALAIAQAEFDRYRPDVVVGSSRGGALALALECGDTPLVLLCPAWRKFGPGRNPPAATVGNSPAEVVAATGPPALNPPTLRPSGVVLHSRADDVVPYADSEELVRASGLPASALIEVGTDHRLAEPEPLAAMLRACEAAVAVS
jgi:hypothetical protein